MIIEKKDKKYEVVDHHTYYAVKLLDDSKVKREFTLSRKDFKNLDEVKTYVLETNLF